jgi:penicillin-binding protein 1A
MRTRKPVPVHNLKVTRKGKVKKRSILWRWRRALYLAALAVTVGTAGLVYVVGQVELPVDPRVQKVQKQTSFVCASDVQVNCNASNAMAQLHGSEDRVLVTYKQIPPVLREAVLSAEDQDFFEHGGVDPVGIARAAYRDLRKQGVQQGGSTITQQYVKTEYLSSERTRTRKIKEAVMAVKLEQQLSKQEILTRYLNTVYFGRGAYGVQAASRVWFGHDVEALNIGEAAFLAGLLRAPEAADPYRGAKGLRVATLRRRRTLIQMEGEGYITARERRLFDAVPMDPAKGGDEPMLRPPPKPSTLGQDVKGEAYGSKYFVEHVRRWLIDEFGEDQVYGGGLKVYTTIDLNMQKAAFDAVTTTLDRDGDPSGSIVALDDQGQVKAMMGGTDFDESQVNLATGSSGGGTGRQPGSTFKAFALAEAIHEGFSIRSVLPAPSKVEIREPACLNGEDKWTVKGGPGGAASLVNATKSSINTVYAQLMARLGPGQVLRMAKDLGVTAPSLKPFCSLVLGGGEVSVLDMASAYSTFANNGMAKSPVVVTRVELPDGSVRTFTPTQKQVLTPAEAGRVTYSLQQVVQGGTGKDANFGRPAAGKTGTTQSNVDAWFVGYTPKLTAAVWMGHPRGQIPMNDVHGIKVQGGTFPAQMWRKFMEAATVNFDTGDFPELDPEELGAGATLDPRYGRTSISSGGGSGGGGGGTTRTTQPQTQATTPSTSTPASTTPQTTSPPSTAPPTTAPATTAPATTAPAAGTGTGKGKGRAG